MACKTSIRHPDEATTHNKKSMGASYKYMNCALYLVKQFLIDHSRGE